MEAFFVLVACFGWHLAVAALGAWLWAVKPWRLARDYGEFQQWKEQQQPGGNYRYEEAEYVG